MGKFEGQTHPTGGLKEEISDKQVYDVIFAPLWKRLIAWIIDQFLLATVVVVMFYFITGRSFMSLELYDPTIIYIAQIFLLTNMVYFAAMEGFTSQTLGKRVVGISVYEETGGKVSFTSALFRRIGLLIPLFLFFDGIAILFSSKSQRIFDMIAGTVVVAGDYEQEASLFLEGKEVSESLKKRKTMGNTSDFEKDKEKKILSKLKKMKSDLEEKFESGEIEGDRYRDLKRKYESRINQLKKEIGSEQEDS